MAGRCGRRLAERGALLLLLAGWLSGCTTASNAQAVPAEAAAPATAPTQEAFSGSAELLAQEAKLPFASWLADLRREAQGTGVSVATLDRALAGVSPIPRIIELDRRQPEGTITFATYVSRVVTPARIAAGKRHLAENAELLARVAARFHVQPRFIVALWAIESSFGQAAGETPIVPALATLAYDGRRSQFFRGELLAALKILEQGDVPPERMKGSWAGAMGQCQFMPSSYLKYAVDFDGNGSRDIWTTRADVLASIANYLTGVGWKEQESWGREVRLPAGFDATLIDLAVKKPLAGWSALGVRRTDGTALPSAALNASLVRPEGGNGRAFLVYDNFRALMNWNRSTYFATSVGLLADAMGDSGTELAQGAKREAKPARRQGS